MGLAIHNYDAGYAPKPTIRRHFMRYTSRACQIFEYQDFFFAQREKLATMLNAVGAEAKMAPFPACMDYPKLTDAVSQLLEEAQWVSTLTFDQMEHAGIQMAPFGEKVRLVEEAASELRMRAIEAPKAVSNSKRSRRDEDEDEEMACSSYTMSNKRGRTAPAEYDAPTVQSPSCRPFAEPFLQTAWWTQQVFE